jgi:hypothetical protein
MKNGAMVFAVIATASVAAALCPASIRERIGEQAQVSSEYREEASRQIELLVSWAREDNTRPNESYNSRDLD